jgi:ankyrin repeat protein
VEGAGAGQAEGESPDLKRQLIRAVYAKNLDMVENVLNAGADPNVLDDNGDPILRFAISQRGQTGIDLVRLLVDSGADVNALDRRGYALLPIAAEDGKLEIVQILVEAGADIEGTFTGKKSTNNTALGAAAGQGHKEIVEFLIANGANVNHLETGSFYTPLGLAAYSNNYDIVKILLDNGADHTLRNTLSGGQTPLHSAVRINGVASVQALLEAGADVNALTDEGQTPLIHLMSDGYRLNLTQVATLLLDTGADPDHQDNTGNSALHYAAMRGTNEAIPILIEYGADLKLQNNKGQTALDVAKNEEIANLLREAGTE